jgi:hypothetical protein
MLLTEKYSLADIATMGEADVAKGGNKKLYEQVQKGKFSVADAADDMGVTEEEFVNKMNLCAYEPPKQ